jgi:hypothetical protein
MFGRYLIWVGALLIVIIFVAAQALPGPGQIDTGGEWLSWSPRQRATYVDGFITGYLQGSHQACEIADDLFEVGQAHPLGDAHHPSEIPSARCLARMDEYSKTRYTKISGLDFNAYAHVITEFYTKHPEYNGVPFADLMKSLGDRSYKTAAQLYQMALKGELHAIR